MKYGVYSAIVRNKYLFSFIMCTCNFKVMKILVIKILIWYKEYIFYNLTLFRLVDRLLIKHLILLSVEYFVITRVGRTERIRVSAVNCGDRPVLHWRSLGQGCFTARSRDKIVADSISVATVTGVRGITSWIFLRNVHPIWWIIQHVLWVKY